MVYLFEKQLPRESKRKFFHLLIYFSNSSNGQGWDKTKPGGSGHLTLPSQAEPVVQWLELYNLWPAWKNILKTATSS